jgi:hypothetical protein
MKLAFIFSIILALIIGIFSRSLRGDDKKPQVNGGYGRNINKKVKKFKKLKSKPKIANAKQTTVLRK